MATRHHSEPPAKAPDHASNSAVGGHSRQGDPRTKALNSVWGAAVGMLALCIPLCAVLRTPILPILVVAGTAVVSLYIWWSGDAQRESDVPEADALRAKIKELEDRLANVEVINRFEDRLAEKHLQQETTKAAEAAALPRSEEQA